MQWEFLASLCIMLLFEYSKILSFVGLLYGWSKLCVFHSKTVGAASQSSSTVAEACLLYITALYSSFTVILYLFLLILDILNRVECFWSTQTWVVGVCNKAWTLSATPSMLDVNLGPAEAIAFSLIPRNQAFPALLLSPECQYMVSVE